MARHKENNTALFVGLGAAALLLVAAIVGLKFWSKPPPAPPPPAPTVAAAALPGSTPILYRGRLDEDARRYGVPETTPEAMAQPLAHTVELSTPRTLAPGESIETPHLRLRAEAVKAWAKNESGQGFRTEHLVLTVENRSDGPLAYRVDTRVPDPSRCQSQASIPHNAMALRPGEKAERTECLYHPGATLTVTAAETLSLPPLGYFYVSRLLPQQIGLDKRTSVGHAPPKDTALCKFVPWHDIELSGAAWADVMDFYARHDCDEYSFFRGYHLRTAPGPLPATP